MTDADRAVLGAREGFVKFADNVYSATRYVKEGSEADGDRLRTESRLVPVTLVDNYVASVADHLMAWAEKAGHGEAEPILRMSLYSDYTLFRPIIESAASAIWILGPDDREVRIRNAITLANVERVKGQRFIAALTAAGTPDQELSAAMGALDRDLRSVCERVGLEQGKYLGAPLDPSTLMRKASTYVPGPTLDVFRHWAIASAHAHAQVVTVLARASRTHGYGPYGDWTYAEADSDNIAESVQFIGRLINVLVDFLNRRGYVLDRSTSPKPPDRT